MTKRIPGIRRYSGNPIIIPPETPFPCYAEMNAGSDTRLCLGQTTVEELHYLCPGTQPENRESNYG